MLETKSEANAVHIGQHFSVSFQRTLRIPDDGAKYPLPPGLGCLPVRASPNGSRRVILPCGKTKDLRVAAGTNPSATTNPWL
jgi:hypothetical protein